MNDGEERGRRAALCARRLRRLVTRMQPRLAAAAAHLRARRRARPREAGSIFLLVMIVLAIAAVTALSLATPHFETQAEIDAALGDDAVDVWLSWRLAVAEDVRRAATDALPGAVSDAVEETLAHPLAGAADHAGSELVATLARAGSGAPRTETDWLDAGVFESAICLPASFDCLEGLPEDGTDDGVAFDAAGDPQAVFVWLSATRGSAMLEEVLVVDAREVPA